MQKHENSFAHIAIYALAGLIVALALRSAGSDGGVDDRSPGGRMIDEWRQVAAGGHWLGPRDASVVIIEFGDYECPYCRGAHGILRSLRQAFPEDLAIVYRHYPLEAIHPQAYFAARLAECGAQQAAFEATHNYLFELDRLDTIDVPDLVAATGISDRQQFAECANVHP